MSDLYEHRRHWRAIKTIMQLLIMLPFVLLLALWAVLKYLVGLQKQVANEKASKKLTILISGAKMSKSLYFVRWLGQAGHKIILIETPKYWCAGTRYSKYVDKFYTVSDLKGDGGKAYRRDIMEIAKRHEIDWFIPVCSPASEVVDSQVADDLRAAVNAKVLHLGSKYIETY